MKWWYSLIRTQLTILQGEEYDLARWWRWLIKHPFVVIAKPRKNLKGTPKLKLIVGLGIAWAVGLALAAFQLSWWAGTIMALVVIFLPVLPLTCARLTLMPVEQLAVRRQATLITSATHTIPNLKVIGITGSYGKTTVKEILYEILDRAGYALSTPASFNTVGGIARVVTAELNLRHGYFLVEMGAYHQGDIQRLSAMVGISAGILTGIGPQHMERFGSQAVITQTKFELVDYLKGKERVVVDGDNPLIKEYIKKNQWQNQVITVSFIDQQADCMVKRTSDGLDQRLELTTKNGQFTITLHAFGTAMAKDAALAVTEALALGVPREVIERGVAAYRPTSARMSMREHLGATLIDNTFSSNVDSFGLMLTDVNELRGKKALVTPGVVELGREEITRHRELGRLAAGVFDAVVLVGNTDRTRALQAGIRAVTQTKSILVTMIPPNEYWQAVNRLAKDYQWIVLENDMPDQYF